MTDDFLTELYSYATLPSSQNVPSDGTVCFALLSFPFLEKQQMHCECQRKQGFPRHSEYELFVGLLPSDEYNIKRINLIYPQKGDATNKPLSAVRVFVV